MESFLQYLDDVLEFRSTLTDETDRGVALVCAAYLEEQLYVLLQRSFVDDSKVMGRLFDYSGPLGTFSAKIDLAFAMGSIRAETLRALHLVRKIRNSFAHYHKERSFHDQDISSQCRELIGLNPFPEEKNPRTLFIRASISALAEIHAKTITAVHVSASNSPSVESARGSFKGLQTALDGVLAKLTEEQAKRLESDETSAKEKKRILLDVLRRVGVPENELEPDG